MVGVRRGMGGWVKEGGGSGGGKWCKLGEGGRSLRIKLFHKVPEDAHS